MKKALLALSDGTTYPGWSFGATGETSGEVVFNTSMTGYQEVLSDPSYKGQMVAMTYPEIGNYGINEEDYESYRIHVEGFIVKEAWEAFSNWRAKWSLGDFLRQISATTAFLLIFGMAATTAAGVLVFPRLLFQMAIPPLLSLGYVLWAFGAFRGNVVYPVVPPVAAVLLSWFLSLAYHGFTEGKDRRRVRRMLSQYVSPAVLAEVLDHYAEHLQAEVGRKERVTILFSDIRDFTSLSEKMEARSVVEMLNVYFSEMTEAIFSEGGTIDKFIGDAIMCFWGAPVRVEDHAGRAVRAALSMLQRLDRVNAALEARQYPRLRIGISIHTGEVVLGNIGSEKKLDYTAIGDGVNLASRLEGLTKTYGSPILLSEDTFRELNGATPCAVVDLVRVKGKNVPVRLYRPLLGKDASEEERKEAHGLAEAAETAFQLYLGRRWKEAYDAYRCLPPHRTTELLIARCHKHLAEEPPEAWDGVHTLQQK
jgi:adenylate cyclase